MAATLICHDCNHVFDRGDRRAFVHDEMPGRSTCPACTLLWSRATPAWCVKNDCQGLFGEGVGLTKEDAENHLNSGYYDGAGCTVVEVVIVERTLLERTGR